MIFQNILCLAVVLCEVTVLNQILVETKKSHFKQTGPEIILQIQIIGYIIDIGIHIEISSIVINLPYLLGAPC